MKTLAPAIFNQTIAGKNYDDGIQYPDRSITGINDEGMTIFKKITWTRHKLFAMQGRAIKTVGKLLQQ